MFALPLVLADCTIMNCVRVCFAGFTCSAGIACNKLLAKVASAMNKPNQQTVVPPRCDIGLQSTACTHVFNAGVVCRAGMAGVVRT